MYDKLRIELHVIPEGVGNIISLTPFLLWLIGSFNRYRLGLSRFNLYKCY